ncbi:succinate dehydrogenase cytochrome b subunit [Mobilicoccus pelagius]|uniref:Succinate dehydrogenase cytochrome b subunit n=1 Tax=Mobilicoccus pelagius NBRC 104925 TaxID=1089455 RepID=H5UPC0_9MICO|nr:succinate dehydrogenase cytochrome b subunit [Mobilicoccus pelagius]GAB47578.1 succinate dehydrogenase cytochrome b subunit [Mobilicoccus pelagius NBRC 104925]
MTGRPRTGVPLWVLKLTMSVTGIVWAGFALVHLIGNLKVYGGAQGFDSYAHWLRVVGYPPVPHEGVLWSLRVLLVVALVAHVAAALALAVRARRARGGVRARHTTGRSRAAGAMLPTGLLLLVFLGLHVLDLTLGVAPAASPQFTGAGSAGSPYANLVASFTRPVTATFYVLAMLALAAHLWHGTVLAANDLGVTGARARRVMVWIAGLLAVAVVLGNAGIPLAVQMGVLS